MTPDPLPRASLFFARAGAVLALLGVAAGAFGAHALRGRVPEAHLAAFETGVRYQLFHALALFAVAWLCEYLPHRAVRPGGWLLLAGTVVFSGSLYALTLTGVRGFGAVTPLGGLLLLAGWAWLLHGLWGARR